MGLFILIVLLVLLLGSFPSWPYSGSWGYSQAVYLESFSWLCWFCS